MDWILNACSYIIPSLQYANISNICDRLCINHTSTAFNQILFFMSFSSPIYGDYNGIFLIFIRVTLQNLLAPVRNRSGIFHFEKSAVFHTLQLLRTTLHKSCGRINAHSECNAGRSGDLRSGLTRDYSKKLPSKETTRFDEENQVFLTADCGHLQVSFASPHSLSVNGSSSVAPGKTIRSRSMVLRHKVANTP